MKKKEGKGHIKVGKNGGKGKACVHICVHVFKRKNRDRACLAIGSLKMRKMFKEDF